MAQTYFVLHKEKVYGPFSNSQINAFIAAGKVQRSTLMATSAQGPWRKAAMLSSLFPNPLDAQSANIACATKSASPSVPNVPRRNLLLAGGISGLFALSLLFYIPFAQVVWKPRDQNVQRVDSALAVESRTALRQASAGIATAAPAEGSAAGDPAPRTSSGDVHNTEAATQSTTAKAGTPKNPKSASDDISLVKTFVIDLRQDQVLAVADNARVFDEGADMYWFLSDLSRPGVITYRFEAPFEIQDVQLADFGVAVWNKNNPDRNQDTNATAVLSVSKNGKNWTAIYSDTSEGGVVSTLDRLKEVCGGRTLYVRATLSVSSGTLFRPSQFLRRNYHQGQRATITLFGPGMTRPAAPAVAETKLPTLESSARQPPQAPTGSQEQTWLFKSRGTRLTRQQIEQYNEEVKGEMFQFILGQDVAGKMRLQAATPLLETFQSVLGTSNGQELVQCLDPILNAPVVKGGSLAEDLTWVIRSTPFGRGLVVHEDGNVYTWDEAFKKALVTYAKAKGLNPR